MPYVRYSDSGLSSMSEAARQCNLTVGQFWRMVREEKLVPEPTTRRGGRFFYDPSELKAVTTVVNKLKKEGKVK